MYTWGYIKENILAKLNLSESEANQQNFLSRFPYFANEAMTQICSSVKPKRTRFRFMVLNKEQAWLEYTQKYGVYTEYGYPIEDNFTADDAKFVEKQAFWKTWNSLYFVNEPITMPDDFISFGSDDIEYRPTQHSPCYVEGEAEVYDYNKISCNVAGYYEVPYNARWFLFTRDLQNNVSIPAPIDICEAIPSYVASQCLKIDDEVKAAVLRNEYEMFVARIDDDPYSCGSIKIDGGW